MEDGESSIDRSIQKKWREEKIQNKTTAIGKQIKAVPVDGGVREK